MVGRKYWHQCLRWPFTSASNFVTKHVLNLPKPSLLERYSNITFVFTLSGIMHVVTSIATTEDDLVGTMVFFQSFAVLIMVEDGVQELWRRWSKEPFVKDGEVAMWKKIVGYAWVLAVIILVAPWFQYSTARLPKDKAWIVPYSIVKGIGVRWAGAASVLGGLLAMAVLKPEI
jgi:hypothetical protein